MIKGSTVRKADHPVDALFIDRWSPRAMTGEKISQAELDTLLEAARWAPSSNNNQPWRILYAHRETAHWPVFFNLLAEGNRPWVDKAGVLLVFVSRETFDNGKPSITHAFDTGSAWQSLALQGFSKGLVVHGMQGFDYERARTELKIPAGYQVHAMAAVGKPGKISDLPEKYQEREKPSSRRPLNETSCEGPFAL